MVLRDRIINRRLESDAEFLRKTGAVLEAVADQQDAVFEIAVGGADIFGTGAKIEGAGDKIAFFRFDSTKYPLLKIVTKIGEFVGNRGGK